MTREYRLKCNFCGGAYIAHHTCSRYCSKVCVTNARALRGVDDVDQTCELCSRVFRVNKYRKQRFCSQGCASSARKGKVEAYRRRIEILEARVAELEAKNPLKGSGVD